MRRSLQSDGFRGLCGFGFGWGWERSEAGARQGRDLAVLVVLRPVAAADEFVLGLRRRAARLGPASYPGDANLIARPELNVKINTGQQAGG